MDECNHQWQGDCRGVHCLICGEQLSTDQYIDLCRAKEQGGKDVKPANESEAKPVITRRSRAAAHE